MRTYFDATRARFERPPTISLTQVFIAAGKPVPEDLMARLKAGGDPTKAGGFDSRIGAAIRHASHAELTGLFGPDVARTIAALAGATQVNVGHVAEAVQYRRALRGV